MNRTKTYMKYIISLLKLALRFVLFLFIGIFIAVFVLNSWPAISQVFVAIIFAIVLTWWWGKSKRAGKANSNSSERKWFRKNKNQVQLAREIDESDQYESGNSNYTSARESGEYDQSIENVQRADAVNSNWQASSEMHRASSVGSDNEAIMSPHSDKKQQGSWITATNTAIVAGRNTGGLLYVGTPPTISSGGYREGSKAYVDPSLSVSKTGNDLSGDDMQYWPSYSRMSPQNRATYLDWLATGRTDATYGVGYMFLFFYGLERRFFVDRPNADSTDIVNEVSRLEGLYAENRSAQRYLGDFLDVAMLSENALDDINPVFDSQRWEVPSSIKFAIGGKLSQSENLNSDWLLAWFISHPERNLRKPADRCREEFIALFKFKFQDRFPDGLKVNKPRKLLKVEYRAASGEFQIEIEPTYGGEPVPDISGLRKPIEIAQEIADETMDDLDKLSRYLGRNEAGRGSLEAHALLPKELWSMFPSESFKQVEAWVHPIVETGGLVPVDDLIERLEGERPVKLTKRNLTGAADALARIGYGLAPDPRFALRSPKLGEPVVIFDLGEQLAELEDVSVEYRAALIEIAVSSFVIHADGQIKENERAALIEKVQNTKGLTEAEKKRLEANLNWMLVVAPDLPLLRRKLKDSTPEAITSLRAALVAASHADGVVQSEEVVGIEKLYKALGIDTTLVYSDLHAGDVQEGPVRVRAAESSVPGEPIPPMLQSETPQLDASRIAAIISDTDRVSSVLGAIFSETEDAVTENGAQPHLLEGLDEKHSNLVKILIAKEAWTEDEVQGHCSELGLMVSGAIETINEWTFEAYDEGLVGEYEGFEVAAEPAELLRKKFAEEATDR